MVIQSGTWSGGVNLIVEDGHLAVELTLNGQPVGTNYYKATAADVPQLEWAHLGLTYDSGTGTVNLNPKNDCRRNSKARPN